MQDQELIQRIKDTALLEGDFTLRSGRRSRYYLDKYLFETQPDILQALGQRLAQRIDNSIDRLAGAELGGIPLVTAASLASGKPSVLIRNQKKNYGTGKQIEGVLHADERLIIIEDIVTTGGQVIEAAQAIEGVGAKVIKVVAVIDRQEGGSDHIQQAGFTFESLLTKADLGINE